MSFIVNTLKGIFSGENIHSISQEECKLDELKCPICLDEHAENPEGWIGLAKCNHCFHETCLQTWLEESKSCPCCRIDLKGRIYVCDLVPEKKQLSLQSALAKVGALGSISALVFLATKNLNAKQQAGLWTGVSLTLSLGLGASLITPVVQK